MYIDYYPQVGMNLQGVYGSSGSDARLRCSFFQHATATKGWSFLRDSVHVRSKEILESGKSHE